jgi:hypothetical protein
MSEHEVRWGGSGEPGSGELPGQEYGEGPSGGPPSLGDDDQGAVALDELPEPEGDPVETDDVAEAVEEADDIRLELVREELATFAEPEGSPYDAEDDAADDDHDADDDADDYDEAELDDYADADDYEDDAADDGDVDDGDADGDAEGGYDSAGGGE